MAATRSHRAEADARAASRSRAEGTFFLTSSVADAQQTYSYSMPDDAVLAATTSSIVASPGASVASRLVNLISLAELLLSAR